LRRRLPYGTQVQHTLDIGTTVGRNGYAEVRLVKARMTRLEVFLGMAGTVSLAGPSTKGDYHVTTTYADD
jgi:hypothetical protein